MATVASTLQSIRETVQLTTTEMTDARVLYFLDRSYKKLWGQVTQLDKNYSLKQWDTNLLANTSKYDIKEEDNTTPSFGQKKIERLEIKYANQGVFVLAEQRDRDNLDYSMDDYSLYTNKQKPFFIITDNSIQIFPTPTETVPLGIKMLASQKPYDLTLSMTSTNILLPDEFVYVLEYMTISDIERQRQRLDLSQEYESKADRERQIMRRDLIKRSTRHITQEIPRLNMYNTNIIRYVW